MRSWVVQERALSIRTIHFGRRQLFWECNCGYGSEVFPEGFLQGTVVDSIKSFADVGTVEPDGETLKLNWSWPASWRSGTVYIEKTTSMHLHIGT